MRITVLTHTEEAKKLKKLMLALSDARKIQIDCQIYENYDDFIKCFPSDASQAVIVARHGADGMECARNAKLMRPNLPLVWLSDDEGFGIESYRIGCAFFSADTITEKLLSTALKRCGC